MITDDWSSGVSLEWDNIGADRDWRFDGSTTGSLPSLPALAEDNPIDIEGGCQLSSLCE